MIEGEWVENSNVIVSHVVAYYFQLYSISSVNQVKLEALCNLIPSVISVEDNDMLTTIPGANEIKDAVFELDPDSSPGPNGYTSSFFCGCWDIVGSNVIKGAT